MAGVGKTVVFHGAFGKKEGAAEKELHVANAFVKPATIKGHSRYLVLTDRKK